MSRISKIITIIILTLCLAKITIGADGTKDDPFNVLLVPADGGTEEGTISDFKPIFNAISLATNYSFNIIVGQSYSAVVEGICSGLADFAWFGPVTYLQARDKGCVELLAVEVRKGSSVYYAGIFTNKNNVGINNAIPPKPTTNCGPGLSNEIEHKRNVITNNGILQAKNL